VETTRRRTDVTAAEVAARYREGASLKNIARALGAGATTVRRRFVEAGMRARPNPQRLDLPVEDIARRYRAGESTTKIGRLYGVDHGTIARRLEEVGIKRRPWWEVAGGRRPGGPFAHDGRGYFRTLDREGKSRLIHRGCWEARHGAIPAGYIVHHKNGDPKDNRHENLACMSHRAHSRLHGRRKEIERFMAAILVPVAVLVVFCNLQPGLYQGTCDDAPITFEVDASGAIGVECESIHAVLTTSGGSVTCRERAR
jgi:transposase